MITYGIIRPKYCIIGVKINRADYWNYFSDSIQKVSKLNIYDTLFTAREILIIQNITLHINIMGV